VKSKTVIYDQKELLKKSGISLVIGNYDDIFSDFDPRPYTHRSLSDDFLAEAKRASYEKPMDDLELKFLLPATERKVPLEKIIRTRLHEHFIHHYNRLMKEKYKLFRKGFMFIIAGMIFMFITSYLLFRFHESSFWLSFLIIILEPAGWFSFWEGLNILLFEPKNIESELNFYKKMTPIKISFWTY